MLRLSILSLFILSGFTSLIYQAVWIRLLSLAVGSTSASMSLVLGIFFLGLAAGSFCFGQWSERIQRPLKTYGILEGLIGFFALIVFFALSSFPWFVDSFYSDGQVTLTGHFLKYGFVFLILLPPTFLMGASLPLLVQLFKDPRHHFTSDPRKEISLLYGLNTLGAVLGAFSAGFVLYPWIGIDGANFLAVAGNLLILLVAWRVDRKMNGESTAKAGDSSEVASGKSEELLPQAFAQTPGLILGLSLLTFVTGFVSISMEVIWSKYLGIFLGTNIYGLSLILSIFLSGIALGSLLLSWYLKGDRNLGKLLLTLSVLSLVTMMISTHILQVLPLATNVLAYYSGGAIGFVSLKSALSIVVLFFPALAFGAILPLIIEILTARNQNSARNTGVIYAVNTVGGIAGSVLTGLYFVPHLGSEWTTRLNLILLLIAIAGVIVLFERGRRRWLGLAVVAVVFLSGLWKVQVNFQNLIRSAYQQTLPSGLGLGDLLEVFTTEHEEFVMIHEGETAVISLSHDQNDGANYRDYLRLKTNGLNESIYNLKNRNSLPKYEALLGLLPYSLVRDPQKAFIVGYGGGYSPLFFESTDLKEVVVAEIEEGILKAAAFAQEGKFPFEDSPKIRVELEDARFLLAAGIGGPYDIIASQPSHSWLSGVANLFTKEFFQIVQRRLSEKGVFAQWLNLYNMDPIVLKSILKTFYTVFPHGAVFTNIHDEELILIGSQAPVQFNLDKLNQMFKSPLIMDKVADIPLREAADLVAHLVVTREEALAFSSDANINSDLNAYAEILQSRLFYRDEVTDVKNFLNGQFRGSFEKVIPERQWSLVTLERLLEALYHSQSFYRYNQSIGQYQKMFSSSPEGLSRLAHHYFQMERYASALSVLQKENIDLPRQVLILQHLGRLPEARQVLSRMPQGTEKLCLQVQVELASRNVSAARSLLIRLDRNASAQKCGESLDLWRAQVLLSQGEWEKAGQHLARFLVLQPSHLLANEQQLAVALLLGDEVASTYYLEVVERLRSEETDRLQAYRVWLESLGLAEDARLLPQKK